MKQYDAVIQTLERLGGQATLGQLYVEVMKISDCTWKTKTPFASIRRIVQTRPEIVKIRPGLWALRETASESDRVEKSLHENLVSEINHAYYQGLLAIIGKLREFDTFIPNQDRNKKFLTTNLGNIRSLSAVPPFSYEHFVSRSESIDVIWFNQRKMPHSMFEVEHTTDFQNSLIKFSEFQDFSARFVIVSDSIRRKEFETKISYQIFQEIRPRVKFLGYEQLVRDYEWEILHSKNAFHL